MIEVEQIDGVGLFLDCFSGAVAGNGRWEPLRLRMAQHHLEADSTPRSNRPSGRYIISLLVASRPASCVIEHLMCKFLGLQLCLTIYEARLEELGT